MPRTRTPRSTALLALGATLLLVASTASGDVPPPNECASSASVGSACTTAGPGFNQDGVCTNATCTSASPPPNGSTFPCVLCQLADAGPTANDAGPDASEAPDASDASTDAAKDAADAAADGAPASNSLTGRSGCSVSGQAGGTGSGSVGRAAGLLALLPLVAHAALVALVGRRGRGRRARRLA
jgi:hypothetical protein